MTERSTLPPPAPLRSSGSAPPPPLAGEPPPRRSSSAQAADPWTGHRASGIREVRPGSRIDQALTVARRATSRHPFEAQGRVSRQPAPGAANGNGSQAADRFDAYAANPTPSLSAVPDLGPAAPATARSVVTEIGGAPAPAPPASPHREDYGLGEKWGSTWRWTAQGWVDRDPEHPTWRPVVTTTVDFPEWDVDTYLGVVAGEAAVAEVADPRRLGQGLADGREVALEALVDSAVARGAHAVVGTGIAYTALNGTVIVTATGTAVTLRER